MEEIMRIGHGDAKTRAKAQKDFPWAEKIVRVEGGFLCFESAADFRTWNNQK
jgi:hypothetical protein